MSHTAQAEQSLQAASLTRAQAEDLLIHEAELLDSLQLDDWLKLFTPDGVYWMPLDDTEAMGVNAAIMYDTTLRREERVHHLLHNEFPAQSPRSRTMHVISNVRVKPQENGFLVVSNQVIYEMRSGDYKQVGIGDIRPIIATVEHSYRASGQDFLIERKKVLLLNHDGWLGNMTFLL